MTGLARQLQGGGVREPNAGKQLSCSIAQCALTTADALSDSLVYIILHEELLVVVIDGQNSPSLPDIVIQLLHFGFNLQQTPTCHRFSN